jgi:hypothetical protein
MRLFSSALQFRSGERRELSRRSGAGSTPLNKSTFRAYREIAGLRRIPIDYADQLLRRMCWCEEFLTTCGRS